jgi:phosphoglycerol transferase MdoB-like AlkP superfamily enzyme
MGTLRVIDPLSTAWVSVALVMVMVLLAYVNVASPRKWRLVWGSFFTLRLGRQVMREDLDLQDRTLIGLLGAALVVLALFGYQLAERPDAPVHGLPLFVRLLGLVVALIVAQVLLLRLVQLLFQADGGLQEYLYTVVLILVMLGLVLLPLVALMAYQPEWRPLLRIAGLLLVGLTLVYRWVRGLLIGVGEGVPPRHVFLYLCTAEMLPVALAVHAALR